MRAILTGATGLLGSHIATELVHRGWSITAIVRSASRLNALQLPNTQPHICDLSRDTPPPSLFKSADLVIHAAAAVTDWAPWSHFQATTIDATQRICDTMKTAGCRRLIHVSTVGVYGRPTSRIPLRENQPFNSMGRWDYYSNSKIAAEKIVWAAHQSRSLDITILRPAMIYGPSPTGLIARVVTLAKQGKLAIAGNPQTGLPLVHVTDVASAAIQLAESNRSTGQAFNIVNPEPVPQSTFFDTITRALNAPPVTKHVPYRLAYTAGFLAEIWGHLTRAPHPPPITRYRVSLFGHRRQYAIDKIRDAIDWQPRIPFDRGIRDTLTQLTAQPSSSPAI